MGRFITGVAAAAVNATNLPPTEKLPNVCLEDVLLPRKLISRVKGQKQMLEKAKSNASSRVKWSEIKRNKNGRPVLIVHRSKSAAVSDEEKVSGANKHDNNQGTQHEEDKLPQQCGKDKEDTENVKEKADTEGKEKTDMQDNGKQADAANSSGEKHQAGAAFTSEDDQKLVELKKMGKTWREIAQEMKRPQQSLKGRFREISNSQPESPSDKKASGPSEQDKDDKISENKETHQNTQQKDNHSVTKSTRDKPPSHTSRKNAEQEKTQDIKASTKTLSKSSKSSSNVGEAKFTMREWLGLREDDLFTFNELKCLAEIIAKDNNTTWLRVASAFMDKTGRRVHPYDIRDKFSKFVNLD